MVNMMKRNDLERLEEEFPEVKQMTFNNRGYDYIFESSSGVPVKIEYKCRGLGVKYDITPSQVDIPDIYTLRIRGEDKHYHMLASTYHSLAKTHSAIASGHKGKALEVSHKRFIENSTKDLRTLVEQVEFSGINLMDFAA
jgi:hypothetical protein